MKNLSKYLILITISLFLILSVLTGQGMMKKSHSSMKKNSRIGKVLETMNSGGYTYVHLEENGKKFWGAGKSFKIMLGDNVEFKGGMVMNNFYSKTLKRTFKKIMFFTFIKKEGSSSGDISRQSMLPKGHTAIGKRLNEKKHISIKKGSIKKAEGGITVEECYKNSKTLNGKEIAIRGIVVKFSKRIMGKNWIHLRDGTGTKGTNDLTITTLKGVAKVGDQIFVKGKLIKDKNFGSGYKYDVILENSEIKIEKSKEK